MPGPSHWRKAVRYVRDFFRDVNPFRNSVWKAQHRVVFPTQLKPFNRCWHQWSHPAIVRHNTRKLLKKTGINRMPINCFWQGIRTLEQRVNISLGPVMTECFKTLFTTTHPGQPIMHQCNSHRHPSMDSKCLSIRLPSFPTSQSITEVESVFYNRYYKVRYGDKYTQTGQVNRQMTEYLNATTGSPKNAISYL